MRTRAASVLSVLAAMFGCANVLGLPERTDERETDVRDAAVDVAIPDAPPMDAHVVSSCAERPADLGTWRIASPMAAPSARFLSATVYDPSSAQIVLFGGLYDIRQRIMFGDTWVWNGTTWSGALPVMSPSRRFASAMAGAREGVVLFGGADYLGVTRSDTWTWSASEGTWTRRCGDDAPCGPTGRMAHAMAYDRDRDRVVLFGGGTLLFDTVPTAAGTGLSDTWEWDGQTWAPTCGASGGVSCGIPALRGASMAYDPVRKRVVLYGGEGDAPGLVDRVWEYDGARWTRRDDITRLPPPRSFASLTYDTTRARLVLHGGVAGLGGEALVDTWELDGDCWKDVTNAAALPSSRAYSAASYDTARAELVVFSGIDSKLSHNDASSDDATDTTAVRRSPAVSR